jgi:tetratricopeptide (TPR) repeat protein
MLVIELKHIFLVIFILAQFLLCTRISFAYNPCGELTKWGGGPWDYTDPINKPNLLMVENFHFTTKVENLIGGSTAMTPLGDINFTLNAFPNHHRALNAVSRYEIKKQKEAQQGGRYYNPETEGGRSAECYFDRAIRWRPNDPNVHLIYGIHLHRLGKLDQALAEYKISEKIQPNSADLQYNLGLLYFDKQQYTVAKGHAKKAYQLGYPLLGLRKKLAGVGQWP